MVTFKAFPHVGRYQKLLAGSSKQPLIDLRAVSRDLPVKKPPEGDPPVFVMAAADDFVVVRRRSLLIPAPFPLMRDVRRESWAQLSRVCLFSFKRMFQICLTRRKGSSEQKPQ